MLATNGRIIISPKNDYELLDSSIKEMEELLSANLDKKVKFKHKSEPFNHYLVPEYLDARTLCEIGQHVTEIQYRSINDDMMTLLQTKVKKIRHDFTQEEMVQIGEHIVSLIDRKKELEEEKKNFVKRLNDQIAEVESEMEAQADLHKMGYEDRDTKTIVKISFAHREKYYCDPDTGECLLTEELSPEDMQLRIDYNPTEYFEDPDDFAKPESHV